jgi:DNA-binding IclR family transcriptional regulator
VDEGNYIRGVTIIAAPVRPSGGSVSHVVVVVGVSEQVRQTGVDTLARELRTIAESLSHRLGAGSAP